MKKRITVCMLILSLCLALFLNATAEFNPKSVFSADVVDCNDDTGTWCVWTYYTPETDSGEYYWIGLGMNGDAESFYAPVLVFSVDDGTNNPENRVTDVCIKVGFTEYHLHNLETDAFGEQYICLGNEGMKMLRNMDKWGFEYILYTRDWTYHVMPIKGSSDYKTFKKVIRQITNSDWQSYFNPDTLWDIDNAYPIS